MATEDPAAMGWQLPKLRVDRNGDWFDDDVEITHAGVLANLRSGLKRDTQGYYIQTRVRIPVEVEDKPFVVSRIERRGEALHAILSDGTGTDVDPATVHVGRNDVPYCTVRDGAFEAKPAGMSKHSNATFSGEEKRVPGPARAQGPRTRQSRLSLGRSLFRAFHSAWYYPHASHQRRPRDERGGHLPVTP